MFSNILLVFNIFKQICCLNEKNVDLKNKYEKDSEKHNKCDLKTEYDYDRTLFAELVRLRTSYIITTPLNNTNKEEEYVQTQKPNDDRKKSDDQLHKEISKDKETYKKNHETGDGTTNNYLKIIEPHEEDGNDDDHDDKKTV